MKNIWIGIVVIVVLAIAGFILINNKSNTQPATPTSQPTQDNVTPQESASSQVNPSEAAQEKTVTLTSSGYSPSDLTIKAGTKVTWVNKGGSVATVNSDPHPIHTDYSPLNLGSFPDGGTLTLTFDKPGTYGYHNHLDPGQSGKITVQ